jgi:hypothetical protein
MDENKQGNCHKLFSFVARSHVFSQSYSVQKKMNAESVIEKLSRITKEMEAQRFKHRQRKKTKGELLKK